MDDKKPRDYKMATMILIGVTVAALLVGKTSRANELGIRLTLDREMREMERYRENIAALREALHAMTKELDRKADQAEEQVKEVYAAAPIHNLTLFQ